MRTTKALLLSAAITAVGIATSVADPVYSANVVGFINITTKPGFNLIANQLNGTNNTLSTILPSVAENSQVLLWDPTNQTYLSSDVYLTAANSPNGQDGWFNNDTGNPSSTVVGPGTGFFYFNPSPSSDITLTLVGEVPQGPLSQSYEPNFNLTSGLTASDTALVATNGFPVAENMQYLTFNGNSQQYNTALVYLTAANSPNGQDGWFNNDTGDATTPSAEIGSGFFLFNPGSSVLNWNMTFTVK
jgi:hypothetical protein